MIKIESNTTNSYEVFESQGGKMVLKSYQVIIATYDGNELNLDSYSHDYSRTTAKHLGMFLRGYTPFKTPNEVRKLAEKERNVSYRIFHENSWFYPDGYMKNNRHLKRGFSENV